MHSYGRVRYVWIKRGLYKEGVDFARLEALSKGFEVVMSPGELDSKYDENVAGSRFLQIEPVSLLDSEDLLARDTARSILRLDPSKPCVYLQLGAGNINGIHGVQDKIIELLKMKGFQVVLGQSPISLSPKPDLRADSVIVDYPNSKYFNAFDFAVLAGGYNSVCEAVKLGLPAIFLPNTETGADDQLKRVLGARAIGNYEVLPEYSDEAFEQAVEKMLAKERWEAGDKQRNGAETAARLIGQL
jgi:UDP:flavonoid glycosyltransferase YjiC (YdhE family)